VTSTVGGQIVVWQEDDTSVLWPITEAEISLMVVPGPSPVVVSGLGLALLALRSRIPS